MATKINPDFYGAENTFVTITTDIAKKSAYTLADLFSNDIYTGGGFDTTASPWGIGRSSISSDYQAQATKGATWTIYSTENVKKNTPIWFYSNVQSVTGGDRPEEITGSSATAYRFARMLYKNRTSPAAELSGNNLLSQLAIDENDEISVPNTNTITPVTFLDYSKTRVCLGNVYYKVNGNPYFRSTSFANFATGGVTTDAIYGFDFTIRDIYGNVLNVYASIGGGELPIPDYYKTCYYGDDASSWVRPWRCIQSVGYWSIPNLAWREFDSSTGCINTADMETVNADDNARSNASNGWGHSSETLQTFDDVSYHWEMGFTPRLSSDWWDISKLQTGDTYVSGLFRSYAYMEIDDGAADYESLTKAILHEISFLGLPFCFSTAKATSAIGSDDIYLPVFDEHMITTGEYANGAESLTLPNAAWSDIFGDEMPEYDPEYDPDVPPEPDSDFGNLLNMGNYNNRFDSKLKIWCFYGIAPHTTINTVIDAINDLYITDPDGNSKWQLDFKGSNPSDYIVGLYVTPLVVPHSTDLSTFTIGPVDFDGNIQTFTYNGTGYFTFGTINLYGNDYPLFGDFRDYAPYTQIELYIPLCGTVTLDPAFFVGHSITVDMYYDITTMSCTAAIYRDGITLYKTVNGSIGAQIPITSLDMGNYQNTIHALESAQKQNDMRLITSVMTMGVSAAAAIATGGVSLGIGAGALAGGAGLLQTVEQGKQIDYQLDHTAPTVSQTGTADAQNGFCVGSMYAHLFIKRAKLLNGHNDTVYSKTVGNACCINDYIGSRTGLVVCSNINANDIVNAYGESPTVDEINAIKQAFSTGVYV